MENDELKKGKALIEKIYQEKLNGNPDELDIDMTGPNFIVKKGSKKTIIKRIDVDDKNEVNIENKLSLLLR